MSDQRSTRSMPTPPATRSTDPCVGRPTRLRADRGPARQASRGVAVVAALLVVALATTIVAGLFVRENVSVRGVENRLALSQTRWIERAALDWARVILRVDLATTGSVDHLGEAWAAPVAETRLDETVTAGARFDGSDRPATLSGRILDAQSMFNLTTIAQGGRPVPPAVAALRRLLALLGQPDVLADAILARVVAGQARAVAGQPETAASAALPLVRIDDLLGIPGVTPAIVEALRPFVVILPAATPVNLNTAQPEVLAAVIPDLDLSAARRFAIRRERTFFRTFEDVAAALDGQPVLPQNMVSVGSSYFIVQGVVRFERVEAATEALLSRTGQTIELLWHHRH